MPLTAAINCDSKPMDRGDKDSGFATLCERESRRPTLDDQAAERMKEL